MKVLYDEDIAIAKLLKWIVKTDQSFSTVDNEHLQDYANYLKSNVGIPSSLMLFPFLTFALICLESL